MQAPEAALATAIAATQEAVWAAARAASPAQAAAGVAPAVTGAAAVSAIEEAARAAAAQPSSASAAPAPAPAPQAPSQPATAAEAAEGAGWSGPPAAVAAHLQRGTTGVAPDTRAQSGGGGTSSVQLPAPSHTSTHPFASITGLHGTISEEQGPAPAANKPHVSGDSVIVSREKMDAHLSAAQMP